MKRIKLGKNALTSHRRSLLRKLVLEREAAPLVDVTANGSIVLRPAGAQPVEIYSDERIREFHKADRMTRREAARVAALARMRR